MNTLGENLTEYMAYFLVKMVRSVTLMAFNPTDMGKT